MKLLMSPHIKFIPCVNTLAEQPVLSLEELISLELPHVISVNA